jgi:hypothetical protein
MKKLVGSKKLCICLLFALFAAFLIPTIAVADGFGSSAAAVKPPPVSPGGDPMPRPVPEAGLSVLLAAGFVGLGIVLYVKRRKSSKKANLS